MCICCVVSVVLRRSYQSECAGVVCVWCGKSTWRSLVPNTAGFSTKTTRGAASLAFWVVLSWRCACVYPTAEALVVRQTQKQGDRHSDRWIDKIILVMSATIDRGVAADLATRDERQGGCFYESVMNTRWIQSDGRVAARRKQQHLYQQHRCAH